MSAQPANTSISVFRNVRTQRNIVRHDSVAAIIKHLRPLVAVKPGEEINVGVLTRDTNVSDFSPYMGKLRLALLAVFQWLLVFCQLLHLVNCRVSALLTLLLISHFRLALTNSWLQRLLRFRLRICLLKLRLSTDSNLRGLGLARSPFF